MMLPDGSGYLKNRYIIRSDAQIRRMSRNRE